MVGEFGIVKAGSLGEYNNFDPNGFFENIHDAESAKMAVGRVKALEDMLKAAEQYGEYASKFCLLEAQMYIQIAHVDGADAKLTEGQRSLVNWIRGKTEEELEQILGECADGTRLRVIKNRELRKEENGLTEKIKEREYKRISEEIVKRAENHGITKLSPAVFYDEWKYSSKPDGQIIKGEVERTRDKLLRKQILGLGDGDGTYIDPNKCKRDVVAQMVETRLESIYNDINSLAKLCMKTSFVIPESGLNALHESINGLAVCNG